MTSTSDVQYNNLHTLPAVCAKPWETYHLRMELIQRRVKTLQATCLVLTRQLFYIIKEPCIHQNLFHLVIDICAWNTLTNTLVSLFLRQKGCFWHVLLIFVSGIFYTLYKQVIKNSKHKKNPLKPSIKKAIQDLDLDSKRGREHFQTKTPLKHIYKPPCWNKLNWNRWYILPALKS